MGKDEETRTLLRPASGAPGETRGFVLRVSAGPDRGRTLALGGPLRVLVGQSATCELRVSDPHVSRRHLKAIEPANWPAARAFDLRIPQRQLRQRGAHRSRRSPPPATRIALGSTVLAVEDGKEPARPALSERTSFGRLVGASAEMRALYPLLERLAASDIPAPSSRARPAPCKEVVAEAIHEQGPRHRRAVRRVFDCTCSVPPSLAESELFGHERGAFTGAMATRRGVFEQADRRHALHRRDRRPRPLAPAQAPPRARAIGGAPPGERALDPQRSARPLRHAARPRSRGAGRPLPRRSLLSPRRRARRAAAAAAPPRGRGGAGRALLARARPAGAAALRAAGPAGAPRVAGERARAQEHHGPPGRPRRGAFGGRGDGPAPRVFGISHRAADSIDGILARNLPFLEGAPASPRTRSSAATWSASSPSTAAASFARPRPPASRAATST